MSSKGAGLPSEQGEIVNARQYAPPVHAVTSLHQEWQVVLRQAGTVVLWNPARSTLSVEQALVRLNNGVAEHDEEEADTSVEYPSSFEEVGEQSAAAAGQADDRITRLRRTICPTCKRPFEGSEGGAASHFSNRNDVHRGAGAHSGHGRPRQPSWSAALPPLPSGQAVPRRLQQESRAAQTAADHISTNYFGILSESHHNSPRTLSPVNSRPGTPVVAEITSTRSASGLDASSFQDGYYARFFVELEMLGRGMTGSVYLCQHMLSGNKLGLFACKKIPVGNSSPSLIHALKEINHLQSLRHRNIVAVHHVWLENSAVARGPSVPCLFALMDYANGGSLERYIRLRGGLRDPQDDEQESPDVLKARMRARRQNSSGQNKQRPGQDTSTRPIHLLSVTEIFSLAQDIVSGLAFLHSHNMLHLDLKADNVLLHRGVDDNALFPMAMLSDFGSSEARNAISNRRQRSGTTGTLDYLAPDAFDILPNGHSRDHSAALDLWALGLILHLLAFFQLPYEQTSDVDALTAEIRAYRGFDRLTAPHRRRDLPQSYVRLLEQLINIDAAQRPSAADVLDILAEAKAEYEALSDASATNSAETQTTSAALIPTAKLGRLASSRDANSAHSNIGVQAGVLLRPGDRARKLVPLGHLALRVGLISLFGNNARGNYFERDALSVRAVLLLLTASALEALLDAGLMTSLCISVAFCSLARCIPALLT